MTTLAQLRRAALGLPAVEERADAGPTSFAVAGKGFATLTRDGAAVQLHLPEDEAHELASSSGGEVLRRSGRVVGARVPLEAIDGQQLNHWVRQAWSWRAPRRLATDLAATDARIAGSVGDLPRAIGNPATRTLAGAGVTSLDDVAEYSESELLALHGVGPKAVRILAEALAARGRSTR